MRSSGSGHIDFPSGTSTWVAIVGNLPQSEHQRVLATFCAQQGIMLVPLAMEVLGGLSRTLKKALLRMSLLADSRNYQSVGQSIAFDRAVQSLSVVIIRGSANMLLSRAP